MLSRHKPWNLFLRRSLGERSSLCSKQVRWSSIALRTLPLSSDHCWILVKHIFSSFRFSAMSQYIGDIHFLLPQGVTILFVQPSRVHCLFWCFCWNPYFLFISRVPTLLWKVNVVFYFSLARDVTLLASKDNTCTLQWSHYFCLKVMSQFIRPHPPPSSSDLFQTWWFAACSGLIRLSVHMLRCVSKRRLCRAFCWPFWCRSISANAFGRLGV